MFNFNHKNWQSFSETVGELLDNEKVLSMRKLPHHLGNNCFEHSVFVAYISFRIARRLRLDYRAAARGGLLHDLYLYNNRTNRHLLNEKHGYHHPKAALINASKICSLSDTEENIIVSHMWPMADVRPRTKEAVIVNIADKYCATVEVLQIWRTMKLRRLLPAESVAA